MGTRSLTIVEDEGGAVLVNMYRQMDGYPEGHGKDLVNFLKTFDLTNGIQAAKSERRTANGMGCLAAQVVAHFKQESGGIYLIPSEERDAGAEYLYFVRALETVRGGIACPQLEVEVRDVALEMTVFKGPVNTWSLKKIEKIQRTVDRVET